MGGQLFLAGDPDFRPEEVTAFELGVRGIRGSRLSYSASLFYDEYDDLRTIEITPVTLLPLRWGNLMKGSAYGVEAWANFQVTPMVAVVAGVPLGAQTIGVPRGFIGVARRRAGRQRSALELAAQVVDGPRQVHHRRHG